MYVHVPKARDQKLARPVHQRRAAGNLNAAALLYIRDPVPYNDYGTIMSLRTGSCIDHGYMANVDGVFWLAPLYVSRNWLKQRDNYDHQFTAHWLPSAVRRSPSVQDEPVFPSHKTQRSLCLRQARE
jgi:hypothetical protein